MKQILDKYCSWLPECGGYILQDFTFVNCEYGVELRCAGQLRHIFRKPEKLEMFLQSFE